MDCRYFAIFLALSALSRPTAAQIVVLPACYFNDIEKYINCENFNIPEVMDYLKQNLDKAAETMGSFQFYIYNSVGDAFPVDLLKGYNLTAVSLSDNDFTEMPYEFLSYIDSPILMGFLFSDEYFYSHSLLASNYTLPFAGSLRQLGVTEIGLDYIADDAFSQYTGLIELNLFADGIVAIEKQLLGLPTLEKLSLDSNSIVKIETGAFANQQKLRYLDLSFNYMTTLQEGAFDGLENSPITDINLLGIYWNCDCDLQWLKDWLDARNLLQSSQAVCATPTIGPFADVNFCP